MNNLYIDNIRFIIYSLFINVNYNNYFPSKKYGIGILYLTTHNQICEFLL